uniref:Uncharacterized protein n=1 Tax=Lepeophtheirus salmonis TaxID=72036 RepID=A0A0K2UIR2_LEPSM
MQSMVRNRQQEMSPDSKDREGLQGRPHLEKRFFGCKWDVT